MSASCTPRGVTRPYFVGKVRDSSRTGPVPVPVPLPYVSHSQSSHRQAAGAQYHSNAPPVFQSLGCYVTGCIILMWLWLHSSSTTEKSWKSFPVLKQWLRPVDDDKKKELCLFCKCVIHVKLRNLRRHTETQKKNVKAADPVNSARQTKISFSKVSENLSLATSEAEGRIALLVAKSVQLNLLMPLLRSAKRHLVTVKLKWT